MINQWVSSVTSGLFYSPHDGNESNYPQFAITAVQSDQLFYVRAKRRKLIDHLSLTKRKVLSIEISNVLSQKQEEMALSVVRSLLPATCYE